MQSCREGRAGAVKKKEFPGILAVLGIGAQKEKKHPAIMLMGSLLCAVFAGLCWQGYKKR